MKNKLTKFQKDFILSLFRDEKYAGWKGIAEKLLDNGRCIVAGTDCIWHGGIGNFIETSEAEDAIDCLLYEFDFKKFLKSKYYQEYKEPFLTNLGVEKEAIIQQYDELRELI